MGVTHVGQYTAVGHLSDLAPGRCRVVDAAGVQVLLARTSDGLYAVQAICTHAHSVLGPGRLVDDLVECPMHGAFFDPVDGSVCGGPATEPLATYPVVVDDDGTIRVDLGADTGVDRTDGR